MNYQTEFDDALSQEQDYINRFVPLINEFNKIKNILDENIVCIKEEFNIETTCSKTWYGSKTEIKNKKLIIKEMPFLKIKLLNKTLIDNHCYIMFSIDDIDIYLLSIGTIGDYKDKIFIIPHSYNKKEDETPLFERYCYNMLQKIYASDKITLTQFFSSLIRKNRNYLKKKLVENKNL